MISRETVQTYHTMPQNWLAPLPPETKFTRLTNGTVELIVTRQRASTLTAHGFKRAEISAND